MAKWVCDVCGYVYDRVSDPITVLLQALLGKMYRKSGFALFAA